MGATAITKTPTEQEIRKHVEAAFEGREGAHRLAREGVVGWEDAWSNASAVIDSLWDMLDLRDSEERRLSQLEGEAVKPIRDEVRPRLVEALIQAAVTFAAEHPDAPRR